MKKKGFTLVELLAVIIILAVIALIATPIVLNIVESSKKSAFESSVYGIIDTIELEVADKMLKGENLEYEYNFPTDDLEVQGTQPTGGIAKVDSKGKISIAAHNGEWCATKKYEDGTITIQEYDEKTCVLDENIVYEYGYINDSGNVISLDGSLSVYTGEYTSIPTSYTGAPYYEIINVEKCELFLNSMEMNTSSYTDSDLKSICNILIPMFTMMAPDSYTQFKESGVIEYVDGYIEYSNVELDYDKCVYNVGLINNFGFEVETDLMCDLNTLTEFSVHNLYESGIVTAQQTKYEQDLTSKSIDLKTLGNYLFSEKEITGELDLSYLTELEKIGYGTFSKNSITSIKLPKDIVKIGDYAFEYNNITELDLSEYDKLVYVSGFNDNKITSVKFPSNTETIGFSAFFVNEISGVLDLSGLTKLISIETQALRQNKITSVIFPENVVKIDEMAFCVNEITGKLELPTNIETIGWAAFEHNQISELDLEENKKLTTIASRAFHDNQLTSIEIPLNVVSLGGGAFIKNNFNESEALIYGRKDENGDGIAEIDYSVITSYGREIDSFLLPNSIIEIAEYAFLSNELTSVDFSKATNLKKIGKTAFAGNNLTKLDFSNNINLEVIEEEAFSSNEISGELDLSNTKLTTIGSIAFSGINQITSVKLPSTIETIGGWAFRKSNDWSYNPNLTKIINPSGRSFDWAYITESDTTNQNFATGTIIHQDGNIEVIAE